MSPSNDYPRMMFHRSKAPVTVRSRDEEDALGGEWARAIWPKDAPLPEPPTDFEYASEEDFILDVKRPKTTPPEPEPEPESAPTKETKPKRQPPAKSKLPRR